MLSVATNELGLRLCGSLLQLPGNAKQYLLAVYTSGRGYSLSLYACLMAASWRKNLILTRLLEGRNLDLHDIHDIPYFWRALGCWEKL